MKVYRITTDGVDYRIEREYIRKWWFGKFNSIEWHPVDRNGNFLEEDHDGFINHGDIALYGTYDDARCARLSFTTKPEPMIARHEWTVVSNSF